MGLIEWGPSLELGIADLDDQHRRLVDIANKLYASVAAGEGIAECRKALDELAEYATAHFSQEERWFEYFNLPSTETHRADHADFLRSVAEFQERLSAGDSSLATQVVVFLAGWVTRHVGREDRELAHLMRSARARFTPPDPDPAAPA